MVEMLAGWERQKPAAKTSGQSGSPIFRSENHYCVGPAKELYFFCTFMKRDRGTDRCPMCLKSGSYIRDKILQEGRVFSALPRGQYSLIKQSFLFLKPQSMQLSHALSSTDVICVMYTEFMSTFAVLLSASILYPGDRQLLFAASF